MDTPMNSVAQLPQTSYRTCLCGRGLTGPLDQGRGRSVSGTQHDLTWPLLRLAPEHSLCDGAGADGGEEGDKHT
jgi:hypothetical protein